MQKGAEFSALRLLTILRPQLREGDFTERLRLKSRTKRNQNPSFSGAFEKRGVCNQSGRRCRRLLSLRSANLYRGEACAQSAASSAACSALAMVPLTAD